jgi:ankyrin repeat protein
MVGKTRMQELVQAHRHREVQAAPAESPELLRFRDKRGRNLLHLCCGAKGSRGADAIKTASVLLSAGLDVDREASREGDWKATPLWYSLKGRNLALTEFLLKRGASPEHCLHSAAFSENIPAIRLLVAHEARVDAVVHGDTPLLFAVKWSRFKGVPALLELGADPTDSRGRTAAAILGSKRAPVYKALAARLRDAHA